MLLKGCIVAMFLPLQTNARRKVKDSLYWSSMSKIHEIIECTPVLLQDWYENKTVNTQLSTHQNKL